MDNLTRQLQKMKQQRPALANLSLAARNRLLKALAQAVLKNEKQILAANAKDLKNLGRPDLRDRLELNPKRIRSMAQGLFDVAKQPEVLNKILEIRKPKSGIVIQKVSVPLGTIGVIYESRPNVTIDLAALAIKSGNALVLKGGREAYSTNKVLVRIISDVLKRQKLPADLINLIHPTEDWKNILLNAQGLVDLVIPRGGAGLIKWVRENSKIPVIETGAGVCHTFADAGCNIGQAVKIVVNAKTQRPSVCNALDTLVVHESTANKLLPKLAAPLAEFKVQIFADAPSYKILKQYYPAELLQPAKAENYGCEFLSLRMAIKTVKSFNEGLQFVKAHTSGHSEAILSRDTKHIGAFLKEVDAAVVYANSSTRFTDGGEFGMGGEVGISTQKLHARGPMGAEALTSYKWVVKGSGQTRP